AGELTGQPASGGGGRSSSAATSFRITSSARFRSAAPTSPPIRSAHGCWTRAIRRTAQKPASVSASSFARRCAGFCYLSGDHRDEPGTGCPVVALGADVARSGDRVRAAYRAQVEHYIADMEELLGGGEEVRRRAIAAVTSMVGAMLISRAIDDEK